MDDLCSVLREAHRVVVKVGSSSITASSGGIDAYQLQALSTVIAKRWAAGTQVLLVSSGAIAAGMTPLSLARRPKDLATQQAAASAGQGSLMAAYTQAFSLHGMNVGQVLLTADDLHRRKHYVNASRTLERLLELEVVPVINENDAVATDEIRFGDNDRLAALVANLVNADALILLSDVDALYDMHPGEPAASRISTVRHPEEVVEVDISVMGSGVGTGGMASKVAAAQMATQEGVTVLVTSAENAADALAGEDVGTYFAPTGERKSARRRWLAHAANARGRLILDRGAVAAVVQRQRSLLPVGVTAIEGRFVAGDTVELCDPAGSVVARGLVNYASGDLAPLVGRRLDTSAAEHARPRASGRAARTVVRRDDLVVL
ncbi:MAG TPA: glutamate 5-kinase [Ornithinimicrobium sp.]|uniref:glutamate 5-kinase n=1 Tax=Ornithinimicrobium sp. TaxID=1977084 RepID=UPI002B45BED4|nr:glutamate 5-kinase [Ornithinimicrobium sp.]HKJ11994.1 glutamate 5-kinase [Ornithinimicrobium sp.]